MGAVISEEDSRLIEAQERELLRPGVRADRQCVDALLADDFVEIGASGAVFGKSAVLGALPAGRDVVFEASDMRLHAVTGDVVRVGYMAVRTSGDEVRRSLRSSWWRREADGGWRMVFHQGTPDTGAGII